MEQNSQLHPPLLFYDKNKSAFLSFSAHLFLLSLFYIYMHKYLKQISVTQRNHREKWIFQEQVCYHSKLSVLHAFPSQKIHYYWLLECDLKTTWSSWNYWCTSDSQKERELFQLVTLFCEMASNAPSYTNKHMHAHTKYSIQQIHMCSKYTYMHQIHIWATKSSLLSLWIISKATLRQSGWIKLTLMTLGKTPTAV